MRYKGVRISVNKISVALLGCPTDRPCLYESHGLQIRATAVKRRCWIDNGIIVEIRGSHVRCKCVYALG